MNTKQWTRVASLVGAVILVGSMASAQVRPAKDPLTGTWTGYLGRSEATPEEARVEFKLGSNGKVSGTVTGPQLTPGDINSGTFDAATGVLKFTVEIRAAGSGNGGNVTFDGRVSNDTAFGTVVLGGQTGVFKFTKGGGSKGVAVAGAARLSPRSSAEADAAARRGFIEVADWLTRAAELVPADKYSYRPASTVRTFGQLVAHVVDGSHYYCGRGAGKNVQWSDATEKGVTTKAALVAALKQAFAQCSATHDAPNNQVGPLMANVAHNTLHYGNMVTYIRMLGMVPPSS